VQAMRDDQRAHGELEAINPTPASDRIDRLTGPRRKGQGGHAQPSTNSCAQCTSTRPEHVRRAGQSNAALCRGEAGRAGGRVW